MFGEAFGQVFESLLALTLETDMHIIPIFALIAATIFAGVALYITIVEHPARLTLDDTSALAQWKPSYDRALPVQATLAIVGGLAGMITWYQSADWQWLVGSIVILSNWPYTLLVIMPTNRLLKSIDTTDSNAQCRTLLVQWGALHSVRSALGIIAAMFFAWGLSL
jgi:hypothetical protein